MEGRGQGSEGKAKMGLCKPKTTTKLRVILSNPALQAHKDHMANYAIICKFMGKHKARMASMWTFQSLLEDSETRHPVGSGRLSEI